MEHIVNAIYSSPIGDLVVQCEQHALLKLYWLDDLCVPLNIESNAYSEQLLDTLDEYFNNNGKISDFPSLKLTGTEFQCRVWNTMQTIPRGEVLTYGALAKQLGTSSRAIGQACRTNNIPILIPCHRVVAANDLGGFMGKEHRLDRKEWLLRHEGYLTA